MKAFVELFKALDRTNKTNAKVDAIADYLQAAPSADAAWAIYLLSGKRIKRLVPRKLLKEWLRELTRFEEWLVDECYRTVGDFGETVALLVPNKDHDQSLLNDSLENWMATRIVPLAKQNEKEQGEAIKYWWQHLPSDAVFLVNKMLTGALRVGVSHLLIARAIAKVTGLEQSSVLYRLTGDWQPSAENYEKLIDPDTHEVDISKPYPFYLASPLDKEAQALGDYDDFAYEWKWDGIRGQLVKREGEAFLWSRGEELVSEQFPEIINAAAGLPDGTVLDGEILPWNESGVMSFSELQRRLGRKSVGKKLLNEVPIHFHSYDLLEDQSKDLRATPYQERRKRLADIIQAHNHPSITLSPLINDKADTWQTLGNLKDSARALGVEGVMIKALNSPYETGRRKGHWWKWKLDPLTIDAVLLYAQAGTGRRANLFTDYTFAVWNGDELTPITKAYSGLDDKEIASLDAWIRRNTKEKFGPVRSVKLHHVFEIGFEGIARSTRHKSGIALRFPRILRWRKDLTIEDADTLAQVEELLEIANRRIDEDELIASEREELAL